MEAKKAIERVENILAQYKQERQFLDMDEDVILVPEGDLNRWKQETEEEIEALEEALRTMKEQEEAQTITGIEEQTITGINQVAREIHENAVAHGWWDEERRFPEIIALCHSELSEALEEYRSGRPNEWYACEEGEVEQVCNPEDQYDCMNYADKENCKYRSKKPEGIAVELADCIIRILDWCGKEGIDIDRLITEKHEYNKTRPYRHGGKVC